MSYQHEDRVSAMPAAGQPAAPPARSRGLSRGDPARAHAALRLALGLLLATLAVGLPWDRRWHTTHVFDTFYSPPHLFIYTATTLTAVVVTLLALKRGLREPFGPPVRLWPLRVVAPGPVFIAGAGFVGLGLAGLLDHLWHTAFGLDETAWSAPHAMLGWGWLVAFLGFLSCRLALRPARPWHRRTTLLFAFLILGFSQRPLLGPLGEIRPPARAAALARLPVFAAQPPLLHTLRIETAWDLSRTDPCFVLVAALWLGVTLAVLRGLIRRPSALVGLLTLWSVGASAASWATARGLERALALPAGHDPALWLPVPILPAAMALALAGWLGLRERAAWTLAGAVFAALVFATWGRTPLAALAALGAVALVPPGARLGRWLWATLERPTPRAAWTLALGCATLPLLTGSLDLALRHATP